MKHLNWRELLTEHGVRFVDRGANVKRGEVNIQCPFCGSADPSHHMGLNLETGFWACWRNRDHRGKSPLRLLCRLLGVSYHKARQIAGVGDDYVDPDGFSSVVRRLLSSSETSVSEPVRNLEFPPEFGRLYDAPDRFWDYLARTRHFGTHGTNLLCSDYGVMFSRRGAFKDRVILPYYQDNVLVAWTGRAVGVASIRYKDLSRDACLTPPKETLFNADCKLDVGCALIVVEGPLDALKVDVFGKKYGVRAVALSTSTASDQQVYMLEEAAVRFQRVLVMMDTATQLGVVDSMRMRQTLGGIRNATIIPVPFGLKDAAEMSPEQAEEFSTKIRSSCS